MEPRQKELADIKSYIEGVDKEVTMMLQSFQWDRKHLLECSRMVYCSYDAGHKVPPDKKEDHERECCLRSQEYLDKDKLLPEPFDPDSNTLVKFSKEDILKIIGNASKNDPLFKKGIWSGVERRPGTEPLTLERLQATYTPDERRAIHDAAVGAAPACHDLADLALITSASDGKNSKPKSRMEVLAELRDMRRRRAKYRGAAPTRHYSDELRDVIRTQMELYTETQPINALKTKSQNDIDKQQNQLTKVAKDSEHKDNFIDKGRHTDGGHKSHKRYDEFTETYYSREHKNSRGSQESTRYNKHEDRHGKHYSKDDELYRNFASCSRNEKEKRLQSKERSRKYDKYEKGIVIKDEFDKRERHSDYYKSKRDKYSTKHKSDYYEEASSSSGSKIKRRHKYNDYEDREHYRQEDERKIKRNKRSEKLNESQYKSYYDTVNIKQERDSS